MGAEIEPAIGFLPHLLHQFCRHPIHLVAGTPVEENVILPVADQQPPLTFDDLIDLRAWIGCHHGEVGNERIEFAGEVNRRLHRLAGLVG